MTAVLVASLLVPSCRSTGDRVASEERPIRVLFTFDDGPANPTVFGSPTERVLEVLQRERITAAFFVLTNSDRFFIRHIPKAETDAGFKILKRELAEGHLVGVHWGGDYVSQWRRHPSRVIRPAYDSNDDGVCDRVTDPGNALESDLLAAIARIRQAATEDGIEYAPKYVRPPVWRYEIRGVDARPTYAALGLKMILADARYRDTGYAIHPFSTPLPFVRAIDRALRAGETNLVLPLHDSNHWTALKLPGVIWSIRAYFRSKGMEEGKDWRFPASRAEVESILNAKQAYLRGPRDVLEGR